MERRKIKNFRIPNTLKFVLVTYVILTVLTILIYKKSTGKNIAKALKSIENRIGLNCYEKKIVDRRIRMDKSMTKDLFHAAKEIEESRIFFPPQPKYLIENLDDAIKTETSKNVTEEKKFKKILIWNTVGTVFEIGFGRTPFLIGDCQYNNCFVTAQKDRYSASEVDALIWHVRGEDRSLPKKRFPNARYVFLNWEPSNDLSLFANLKDYKDIFDVTITYREDSDIPYPYNEIATRNLANKIYSSGNFSLGKNKMAAWFASNCDAASGSSRLVKQLEKYLEIDIYGRCGKMSCDTPNECFKKVEKEYFFYLSFENSICKDYVTEIFFNALRYEIVPVVFGYGPYWKHAPPNSYIDVFDFTSIKELSQYLIHLSRTPEEYNEYFRWKSNYFVLPKYSGKMQTICKLCEMLNTPSSRKESRYDLQDWVVDQSGCKEQGDPIISNFLEGNKLKKSFNHIRYFIDSEDC